MRQHKRLSVSASFGYISRTFVLTVAELHPFIIKAVTTSITLEVTQLGRSIAKYGVLLV